jgi:N-acetylmuramoyl-L-alanine amidase
LFKNDIERNMRPGLSSLLLIFMLFLCTFEVVAQTVLPRISVATRSDGLGYVFRMHYESAPDSFKVFQPSADLIQVAVYKRGVDVTSVRTPDPGQVVHKYEISEIPGGIGIDFNLNENNYFVARAYMDANNRHLLLGLTQVSPREMTLLTDGMRKINWASLARNYVNPLDTALTDVVSDSTTAADSLIPVQTPVVTTVTPSQPVSRYNNRQTQRLRTIVIDAGHGGRDPGAVGLNRNQEKVIALQVAKKLGAYINEHLPDVKVVYTRDDDTFVDLYERGRIANRAQGDLFVSIHANAARNRQAYGAEVYFLGVAKTEEALEVMKRENSVILLEDPSSRSRELTDEELIEYELTNIGYMSSSQRLAELMDRQFSERAGRRTRGVKQAGFIVLFQASMPAVLVELGFISNAQEERYLASESGQAILASAMFRAIRDYKEQLENH